MGTEPNGDNRMGTATVLPRSIAQLKDALPYLSRAYVFDNSGTEMLFLAEYDAESG